MRQNRDNNTEQKQYVNKHFSLDDAVALAESVMTPPR